MCENSSSPSRACSGLVKTVLKMVTFPGAFSQIPGCLGVARLLGNQVEITPIGLNFRLSSSELLLGPAWSSELTRGVQIDTPSEQRPKSLFILSTSLS